MRSLLGFFMKNLVDQKIENYCVAKSTLPSKHCEEIAKFTRANVPLPQMVIGELEGSFLGFLVGLTQAKRILEIGCFTGYSALAMAERLPAGGEIVTLDFNSETTAIAEKFWERSPHGKKIKPIVGKALDSLRSIQGSFDLVFIDADKENYLRYFERCLNLLSPDGLIVVDNALWGGDVLNQKSRDPDTKAIRDFNDFISKRNDLECCLLPVRDGVFLIRKKN